MVWYDDPLTVTVVLLVVIIACGVVIFAMRRGGKKTVAGKKTAKKQDSTIDPEYANIPFKISKSVQTTRASSAKDELRMLDLERDILGDALRRLYEAQAEGKITEQEREKLALTYKNRMNTIKESIAEDENIVALHELEGMQEDLMKLFSERFGELTSKVEELRTKIDVKTIREIPIKLPSSTLPEMEKDEEEEESEEPEESTANEEKTRKKRKLVEEKLDVKTEAERRIESIRSEVEKVLDKLGQMEIEG